MNKTCYACKTMKPLTCFAKDRSSKDGHQKRCKACKSQYNIQHYQSNKNKYAENTRKRRKRLNDKINEYKNRPCIDCGIWYPPIVMDFDHTQNNKTNNVSTMVRCASWENIIVEIKKCDVVCANCHRIRTYQRKQITSA